MQPLKFLILDETFNLHRLQPAAAIPKALFACSFYSITRSADELSIVAPDTLTLSADKTEPGWSALKVLGPLDFALTGVLAGIATSLAKEDISIFAVSTFDTDYIFVKKENLKAAKAALTAAGHKFVRPSKKEAEIDEGFILNSYHTLLEKQIPLIRKLFTEKIGPAALSTLRSETALVAAVGGLYEFLPTAVRLVVNRDIFVNFCVRNLDKILPDAPRQYTGTMPQPKANPKIKKSK